MTVVYQTAPSLTVPATLELCMAISTQVEADEFVVDFRATVNVEPFSMLLLSSELAALRQRYPNAKFLLTNYERMTYAAHMGFFQSFGVDFGKYPGQASGNSRYVPMTLLKCEEIEKQAAQKNVEVQEEIESQSERLAEILSSETSGPLFETLSYSIREIIRNVSEHSQSNMVGICAQLKKNHVEVAIVDRGIGIRTAISKNPHIDASTDKKALNFALMPAVSGTAFKGSRIKKRGHWANSGFGLYMTNRICRNGGNFFIASGDTGMLLTSKGEGKRYFPCNLHGTAVRLTIRTAKLNSLDEMLDTYRKEGYEFQKKYAEIVNIDPSAASLMLSKDFDLSLWNRILSSLKS